MSNKTFEKPVCNKCEYQNNCPCGHDCCNAACLTIYKKSKNHHKLEIKIPEYTGCCSGIQIYIDRERINAIGLYPLNGEGRRVENFEGMDLEFDVLELEVRDIEDIAVLMNKETFDKFCKLWRKYHEG